MPSISMFFGIVITMNYLDHEPPLTSMLGTQGTRRPSRLMAILSSGTCPVGSSSSSPHGQPSTPTSFWRTGI